MKKQTFKNLLVGLSVVSMIGLVGCNSTQNTEESNISYATEKRGSKTLKELLKDVKFECEKPEGCRYIYIGKIFNTTGETTDTKAYLRAIMYDKNGKELESHLCALESMKPNEGKSLHIASDLSPDVVKKIVIKDY